MADPGFDNNKYWNDRKAEKAFRESWSEWRKEMKEVWGNGFVRYNPHFFTQRAYMDYLKKSVEVELQEQAKLAEIQEHVNQLPAPPPPSNEPVTITAPSESSNVIITDIAPGE